MATKTKKRTSSAKKIVAKKPASTTATKAKKPSTKSTASARKSLAKVQKVAASKGAKKSTTTKKATPTKRKAPTLSRIKVYYDVGFKNSLYIRGEGAGLSWEKGVELRNEGHDLWVWETKQSSNNVQFKVLVNDQEFEVGTNHELSKGSTFEYTPSFPNWGK